MRKEAYIKALRKHLTVFANILHTFSQPYIGKVPYKSVTQLLRKYFRIYANSFACIANILQQLGTLLRIFANIFQTLLTFCNTNSRIPANYGGPSEYLLQIAKHEIKFCKPRFANLQTPCEFLQTFSYSRTSAKLMDMLWLYLVNELSKIFMPNVLKNHLPMNTFTEISTNKLQKQNYIFFKYSLQNITGIKIFMPNVLKITR